MEDIKQKISQIEKILLKQQNYSIFEKMLVPLIVAVITATVSVFLAKESINAQKFATEKSINAQTILSEKSIAAQKEISQNSIESQKRAQDIKTVEVVNLVITNFSKDHPERTLSLVEVIKKLPGMESNLIEDINNLAKLYTLQKVNRINEKEGKGGAEELGEVVNVLTATTSEQSKNILNKINETKYHVMVVGDTTKDNALAFRAVLKKNKLYPDVKVFKTSRRYAVSIGSWNYEEALVKATEYKNLPRFDERYPNFAYPETRKEHWKEIQ